MYEKRRLNICFALIEPFGCCVRGCVGLGLLLHHYGAGRGRLHYASTVPCAHDLARRVLVPDCLPGCARLLRPCRTGRRELPRGACPCSCAVLFSSLRGSVLRVQRLSVQAGATLARTRFCSVRASVRVRVLALALARACTEMPDYNALKGTYCTGGTSQPTACGAGYTTPPGATSASQCASPCPDGTSWSVEALSCISLPGSPRNYSQGWLMGRFMVKFYGVVRNHSRLV